MNELELWKAKIAKERDVIVKMTLRDDLSKASTCRACKGAGYRQVTRSPSDALSSPCDACRATGQDALGQACKEFTCVAFQVNSKPSGIASR